MPAFRGIHYKTIGDSDKPAIIFLHGFLGTSNDWQKTTQRLKEHFYCLLIDLPGHGKSIGFSAGDFKWSFESFSGWLIDFMLSLQIKTISIVGYSMGGRIALHFAVNNPRRVKRLVIESASPGLESKIDKDERLQNDLRIAEDIKSKSLEMFSSQWYRSDVFKEIDKHPNYVSLIEERTLQNKQLVAQALINFSQSKQESLWGKLNTIKIPVILFCGSKDKKYVQIMRRMVDYNPAFKLNIIENCSHNTHFENADLFAEHLLQFLSS